MNQISHKEMKDILSKAIPFGKWHFEITECGVKPVEGEYDPNNKNHVKYEDVISISQF